MMRLTKLPAEVQAYIASGQLSAGHARALIGVPDPAAAAKRIVEEGLNVRQAEALAHDEGVPVRKPQKARGGGGKVKDPDTVALEKRVSDALGLAVSVDHRDPGGTVHDPLYAISNSSTRSCAGWTQRGRGRRRFARHGFAVILRCRGRAFGEPRRMDATKVPAAHPSRRASARTSG